MDAELDPEAAPAARWYAYVLVSLGDEKSPPDARRLPAELRHIVADLVDDLAAVRRVVRTYIGVAVDVDRRARQHNGELAGGARSTRAGRPWHVAVVHGPYPDRGSAQAVEYQLKQRRGAAARLRPVVDR